MAHDVFVCHASADKPVADAACAALEQHGIRCWIAPRDVVPGRDYVEAITEAIHRASAIVLVFSGSANASPHVRRELERAVDQGLAILPIRVDDSVPSASLEYYISGVHWLDALTPPLAAHLERLAEAVEILLAISRQQTPRSRHESEPLAVTAIHRGAVNRDIDPTATRAEPLTRNTRAKPRSWLFVVVLGAFIAIPFAYFVAGGGGANPPPMPSPTTTAPVGSTTAQQPVAQRFTVSADCPDQLCKVNVFGVPAYTDFEATDFYRNGDELSIECYRIGETVTDPDNRRSSDRWLKLAGVEQYASAVYADGPTDAPPLPPC